MTRAICTPVRSCLWSWLAELLATCASPGFAIGLILLVAAVGATANVPRFREGKRATTGCWQTLTAAGAMAIELAGKNVDPEFVPARDLPVVSETMWISAGQYQTFAPRDGLLARTAAYRS